MYRTDLNSGHKSGAIAAVAAVHAALFFVFLNISGTLPVPIVDQALKTFDITAPPPPPPPPPPPALTPEKAKKPEGGSSPNKKSEATPVVAPKPQIKLPLPPKIATSETPRKGTAPTQGAAPVPCPGTGSGGSGSGTGTGSGSGAGGGGGGYVVGPRLVTRRLDGRDFPQQMLRAWPRGRPVFTRVRVGADGSVIQCIVDRGTGIPAIDNQVCATMRARLRYSPARSASGQAVAGWTGYVQEPF